MIEPGLYEHFKGGKAVVLGVAKHSEAHHMQLVFYRHIQANGENSKHGDDQLWARPVEMFTQIIERGTYKGPRFWRIGTLDDAVDQLGVGAALIIGGDGPVTALPAEVKPEPSRPHDASAIGQRQS